jgi:hypothetical protein
MFKKILAFTITINISMLMAISHSSEADLSRASLAVNCAAFSLLIAELPHEYNAFSNQMIAIGQLMGSIASENFKAHSGEELTNGDVIDRRNSAADELLKIYHTEPEELIDLFYQCDAVRIGLGNIGMDNMEEMDRYIKSFSGEMNLPVERSDERSSIIRQALSLSITAISEIFESLNITTFKESFETN